MLRQLMVYLSLILLTVLGLSAPASAKQLASRLGIGYLTNSTLSLPSAAVIYHPSQAWAVVGALGIDTQSNNSSFAATGGVRKIIFTEDNLNFFMGGNLGLLSQTVTNTTNSGFEIAGLVGAEFFLPGLENLGFNFDTGVAVSNISTTRFRTIGDNFVNGGVIFYF